MLFSGIPHLPTFCHVAFVTSRHMRDVRHVCQVSRKVGKWGNPEKSNKYAAQEALYNSLDISFLTLAISVIVKKVYL